MESSSNLKVKGEIVINTSLDRLWDVLTNPSEIKKYLYGSNLETDWKVGSPMYFRRSRLHPNAPLSEKLIVDKGKVLRFERGRILQFSFYSSMEGYEDIPKNYSTITYTIEELGLKKYRLIFLREYIPIEYERKNHQEHLPAVLEELKAVAEKDS